MDCDMQEWHDLRVAVWIVTWSGMFGGSGMVLCKIEFDMQLYSGLSLGNSVEFDVLII